MMLLTVLFVVFVVRDVKRTAGAHRSFATTVSQLKIGHF
jgi:hypothetical protein